MDCRVKPGNDVEQMSAKRALICKMKPARRRSRATPLSAIDRRPGTMGVAPMPRAELPHAKSIRLVMLLLAAAVGLGVHSPASAASDLDRAYRTIAAKKFIDLTHSFAP